MGDSKVLLSDVGKKIVLAVRMRNFTSPEALTEFLGGSDPRKTTQDLLEAGVFLDGDERAVVADVLRSGEQSDRVADLFIFASTDTADDVQSFAAGILATHKDAKTVYDLVAHILSGDDQQNAAVALAIASKHGEVKKNLLAFVSNPNPSEDTNRVIIALRFRDFLVGGAFDARFETISAHDLLLALPFLVPSEEAKLLSKFLRSKAKVSELFDESVKGTDGAYEALTEHGSTLATVGTIGRELNSEDLDRVRVAQDLLEDRRDDVLSTADAVPDLFTAASKGVDGAFDALAYHTKVDAVWGEVRDALLKNVGNENIDRQKTARLLVTQRADLQQKLSAAIGIEVKATGKPAAVTPSATAAAEKPSGLKIRVVTSPIGPGPATPASAQEPANDGDKAEEPAESRG